MPSNHKVRRVAALLCIGLTTLPDVGLASSVGPYGVNRVSMLHDDTDGRPLTFSESDIFACVMIPGDARASVYRVPYGYVTDQTSIPRRAVGILLGKTGRMAVYANAAIVHDYLYASGERTDKAARVAADKAMGELLRSEDVTDWVVTAIEFAFGLARGAAGFADGLVTFFGRDYGGAKEWIETLRGAFGAPNEWKRWANPYTLRLIDEQHHQPWSPAAAKAPTSLENCLVFDGKEVDGRRVDGEAHRLLHTCLHHRFASSANRPLVPRPDGRMAPWPAPRMPVALADLVDDVDRLAPTGDCNLFARTPA